MKALLRVLCYALYYGFAKHLPESNSPGGALFKALRYHLARHMLAECGTDVDINQGAHFGMGRQIHLGSHSGIGKNCVVLGPVRIGNYVGMSFNCFVTGYMREFRDLSRPMVNQGAEPDQEVVIEDDVIILAYVIILGGVHIQTGSVLGAGTVVSKNVPKRAIVAGNPARIVGWRGPTGKDAFDKGMTPVASEKVREAAVFE
jgi:maltose O-acetyltransferase